MNATTPVTTNQDDQASVGRELVDEHAAAEWLKVSVFTLRKDRYGSRRLPFFKVGGRVVYSIPRLREVLQSQFEVGGCAVPKSRRR